MRCFLEDFLHVISRGLLHGVVTAYRLDDYLFLFHGSRSEHERTCSEHLTVCLNAQPQVSVTRYVVRHIISHSHVPGIRLIKIFERFVEISERCLILALLLHASLSASLWCFMPLENEIQSRSVGFAGSQQAQFLGEDLAFASAHRVKLQFLHHLILS